jgi:hypothetical protein
MKYIIMCGGPSSLWKKPKQLYKIDGKPLVQRTIGLLKERGIKDIAITSTNKVFRKYAPLIEYNSNKEPYFWVDAFYPTDEPVTYLFGDVLYSPRAIDIIVDTQTDDIEFFASARPFSALYTKEYAEPFAFKVVNQEHFRQAIDKIKWLSDNGVFARHPIAWELWQVIKHTQLNTIFVNYTVINDYTRDFDDESEYSDYAKG